MHQTPRKVKGHVLLLVPYLLLQLATGLLHRFSCLSTKCGQILKFIRIVIEQFKI